MNEQVNIRFEDTTPIICDECKNTTFTQVFLLRTVSAVLSPIGKQQMMPVPAFECARCGEILQQSLPNSEAKDELPKVEVPSTAGTR